jgi:hypothetical protein
MRKILIPLLLVVLAGCSGSSEGSEKKTTAEPKQVTAAILVELRWPLIADTLDSEAKAPEQCAGALDYANINTGSVVTIKDADGKIVGTANLRAPEPSDNLVICKWTAVTRMNSKSEFFTAEVGGWVSEPQRATNHEVTFLLDTVKEDPEFGSKAQVDPTWTRE